MKIFYPGSPLTCFIHAYKKRFIHPKRLRPMMSYVNHHLKGPLIGVEIGVEYGENAYTILSLIPRVELLHLIDPWTEYVDSVDHAGEKYDKTEYFKGGEELTQERLQAFDSKVSYHQMCSEDAVNGVPDGLDFVYIDGNHSYDYVKKDIELYYRKLKPGGVIGGHDIQFHSIIQAFIELINEKHLSTYYIEDPDWWVVKPL